MTTLQPLNQALAPLRGAMAWSIFFSLCINLLMLTVPLYLLQIFDRVLTSRSEDTLWALTGIALIALVAYGFLEAFRRLILGRLGLLLEKGLAEDVFLDAIHLAPASAGMQSARGLRDLSTLRNYLAGNALTPLLDAPWSLIFLGIIFMLHPLLGWLAGGAFVLLALLALLNEKLTRGSLQQASDLQSASDQCAENAIANSEVIIAMGMAGNYVQHWRKTAQGALRQWEKGMGRLARLSSFSKVLRLVLQVALLGTGALLAIEGELTAGAMIAASILVTRALAPVDQLIGSWGSTIAARKAYYALQEQLSEGTPSAAGSTALPPPRGQIRVEGMSYVHPGQVEPLLKAVTFSIQPGESLGLIGPSGSGKTTLARLLLGVLKPRLGQVCLDGMSISEWPEADRGQYVGYLPQDTELFAGTIAQNIARFADADSEAVVKAATQAGAHSMILQLPKGYDTPVGPRGVTLSGGQRQRIALARALFGDVRFVVLDEPSANQDRAGEVALMRALKTLKERRITSVVIAHRPAIIEYVDKVLVLKDGKVNGFGPKERILSDLSSPATTPAIKVGAP